MPVRLRLRTSLRAPSTERRRSVASQLFQNRACSLDDLGNALASVTDGVDHTGNLTCEERQDDCEGDDHNALSPMLLGVCRREPELRYQVPNPVSQRSAVGADGATKVSARVLVAPSHNPIHSTASLAHVEFSSLDQALASVFR